LKQETIKKINKNSSFKVFLYKTKLGQDLKKKHSYFFLFYKPFIQKKKKSSTMTYSESSHHCGGKKIVRQGFWV
jgi:hypothetical protein